MLSSYSATIVFFGLKQYATRWRRNFRHRVCGVWRKWLNRRSQRAHMTWEKMERLLTHYPLPQPHIDSAL